MVEFTINSDFPSQHRSRAGHDGIAPNKKSIAFVTPTYWRDLARCELLAESLDRCAPDVPHYLIVDRRDRTVFAHLERGRRRIIVAEDLLESCFWRVPGGSGWWLSYRTPPVRGWIMQQIKKIAAIQTIPEQTLVFCDSDTAFFRRFGRENLLVNNKIGLLDVDFANDDTKQWTNVSQRLLGIPSSTTNYRNYVGYIVCWDRDIVEALQKRITSVAGVNWQLALARTLNFSEYMLYGLFVRDVLGFESTVHEPSDVPLIKPRWSGADDGALDDLFVGIDPRTIGIMVHSKDGIDPYQYRHLLEERWAEL